MLTVYVCILFAAVGSFDAEEIRVRHKFQNDTVVRRYRVENGYLKYKS